jgi:hypothetical protein
MTVPYAFANLSGNIALAKLDSNFNTPITIGNTSVLLGNTVTTLNNLTLANVTITSGTSNVTNVNVTNITVTNLTATLANVTTLNASSASITSANIGTLTLTNSLSVPNGGTGQVTFPANSVLVGNGTGGIATVAPGNVGNVLTSIGGAWVSNVAISGAAAGANTQVQYNNSGALAGSANLVFDGANLGLGVTPSAWGSEPALELRQSASLFGFSGTTNLLQNAYYNGSNWIYKNNAGAMLFQVGRDAHRWYTAPSGTAGNAITLTQAMTLDSSGNLLVGQTTSIAPASGNISGFAVGSSGYISASRDNVAAEFNRISTDGDLLVFRRAGTQVGSVSVTTTLTSYNVTSDYRLKNTIAPMTGALAKVALLKPCTYKWNVNGSDGEGFIAHELAEVCPQAVTGAKDEVDADGKPQHQGIDTSFLVATLTAAIQEQQAIIQSLTDRIAQLENKL